VSGSYRLINYSLRPAKATERKMICEALRRLYPFAKIETYRYIGFGSIYFSDFQLFHRSLGMDSMLSIEKDATAKECFEFNKPYKCVDIEYRPASEVLPELDWQTKSIVWLDYEAKLDSTVLSDVASVCAKAVSGSVLIVSVNVHPDSEPDEEEKRGYTSQTGLPFNINEYRFHALRKRLGDCVPSEVEGSQLRGKGLAAVCHRMLGSKVEETLSVRNGVLPANNKLCHQQILYFHYSDNALMATVAWIFFEAAEKDKFEICSFKELDFSRFKNEAYNIQVPCLTLKEMRHLNTQLPRGGKVTLPGVPGPDIERYAKLYRYFPVFTETIFT
jgi:hypothetical protein